MPYHVDDGTNLVLSEIRTAIERLQTIVEEIEELDWPRVSSLDIVEVDQLADVLVAIKKLDSRF